MDDLRKTPEGYYRAYTVGGAIHEIMRCEQNIDQMWAYYLQGTQGREMLEKYLEVFTITEISCDNDLGLGEPEGYKLLDWLEATGRNYPIRIHTDNAVARQRMRAIIERNGWKEIR